MELIKEIAKKDIEGFMEKLFINIEDGEDAKILSILNETVEEIDGISLLKNSEKEIMEGNFDGLYLVLYDFHREGLYQIEYDKFTILESVNVTDTHQIDYPEFMSRISGYVKLFISKDSACDFFDNKS